MWLILMVVAILGVILFPVWPLKLKIGVWYVSVFLLVGIVRIEC